MFGALAEFERDLIRERTQAGLVAARARGRLGGRPSGLSQQAEATALAAETLYREGQLSVRHIAEKLNIAKSTLYVYLRHRGVAIGPYTKRALDTADDAGPVVEAGGAYDHGRPGHDGSPRRPRAQRPQPLPKGTTGPRGLGVGPIHALPHRRGARPVPR
jgi:hypothetical protein